MELEVAGLPAAYWHAWAIVRFSLAGMLFPGMDREAVRIAELHAVAGYAPDTATARKPYLLL